MNRIYRVLWNSSRNQWVVASELGQSRTKSRTSAKKHVLPLLGLSLLGSIALSYGEDKTISFNNETHNGDVLINEIGNHSVKGFNATIDGKVTFINGLSGSNELMLEDNSSITGEVNFNDALSNAFTLINSSISSGVTFGNSTDNQLNIYDSIVTGAVNFHGDINAINLNTGSSISGDIIATQGENTIVTDYSIIDGNIQLTGTTNHVSIGHESSFTGDITLVGLSGSNELMLDDSSSITGEINFNDALSNVFTLIDSSISNGVTFGNSTDNQLNIYDSTVTGAVNFHGDINAINLNMGSSISGDIIATQGENTIVADYSIIDGNIQLTGTTNHVSIGHESNFTGDITLIADQLNNLTITSSNGAGAQVLIDNLVFDGNNATEHMLTINGYAQLKGDVTIHQGNVAIIEVSQNSLLEGTVSVLDSTIQDTKLSIGDTSAIKGDVTLTGANSITVDALQNATLEGNLITENSGATIINLTQKVVFTGGITVNNAGNSAVLNLTGESTIKGDVSFDDGGTEGAQLDLDSSAIEGDLTFKGGTNSIMADNAQLGGIRADAGILDVTIQDSTFKNLDAAGTGNNQLTMIRSTHEYSDDASKVTGIAQLSLDDNSVLTLTNQKLELKDGNTQGLLSIQHYSKLIIKGYADHYTMDHDVEGNGELYVGLTDGKQFNFNPASTADSFNGELHINGGNFALDANNLSHIQNTTKLLIEHGENGSVGVAQFDLSTTAQAVPIQNLVLDGGVLSFSSSTGAFRPLETKQLTLESNSGIALDEDYFVMTEQSLATPAQFEGASFFDQQTVSDHQLVITDYLEDSKSAQLTLTNKIGAPVAATTINLKDEGGEKFGEAHYGGMAVTVNGTTGNAGSINLAYGLTELTATSDTISLVVSDKNGINNAMNAILSGTGEAGFTFDVGPNGITIGNSQNDYTGVTTINNGAVGVIANNAFGNTQELMLKTDAHVDFNTHTQTIGKITSAATSTLNMNQGKLTITNGGVIDGALQGKAQGQLMATGGTLTINSNNAGFVSETAISKGATVTLNQIDSLGSSTITNEGLLNLNGIGEVKNILKGSNDGLTNIESGSDLTFTQDNKDYMGTLAIEDTGKLKVTHINGLGTNNSVANNGALLLDTLSGTLSNHFSGVGSIDIEASEITLNGNNSNFIGNLSIKADSKVITINEGFMMGNVANEGLLTADLSGDLRYVKDLTGSGDFIKAGTGTFTFGKNQAFEGNTILNNGSLVLDQGVTYGTVNSKTVTVNAGVFDLKDDAQLMAQAVAVNNDGRLQLAIGSNVSGNVTLNDQGVLGGYGTIQGDVAHNAASTILVGSRLAAAYPGAGSTEFGTLTIGGNYTGQAGSIIRFGTQYGNDSSPTDKLIIVGDASGTSTIRVDNINGLGALTNKGIELINIAGTSTVNFTHEGRTVGGVYEYQLFHTADSKSWYLTSTKNGGEIGGGWPWWGSTLPQNRLYRPEVGAYIANLAAANTIFGHTVHDRAYVDGSSIWTRINASFGRSSDTTEQTRTHSDYYSLQIGSDLVQGQMNTIPVKFGASFGYGNINNRTRNTETGYRAKGEGDGYSIGVYAIFGDKDRAYVDSWLQYIYFDHDVKGDQLRHEGYKNKGFLASIEGGYVFKLSDQFYIQPQTQLIWMGVKSGVHREFTGTRVKSSGHNLQARAGVRAFGAFTFEGYQLKPYAELNYIYNSKPYAIIMNDDRVAQRGAHNLAQVKLGTEAQIGEKVTLWGDLSHSAGKKSYRDTKVSFGFKYTF